jgi:CheY-like chemotaxis protein
MNASDSKRPSPFKVLVLEDNLMDFRLLAETLKHQFDCEVDLATTKAEFEVAIDWKRPSIIISDSNLTGFDGISALKIVRQKCPSVPFVFCCGLPPDGVPEAEGVPSFRKGTDTPLLMSYIKTIREMPSSGDRPLASPRRYVRLKLNGEVVRIERANATQLHVRFMGETVALKPEDVTELTQEEHAKYEGLSEGRLSE